MTSRPAHDDGTGISVVVLLHHENLAQKYEADPGSVGDNEPITGRRGQLPPS